MDPDLPLPSADPERPPIMGVALPVKEVARSLLLLLLLLLFCCCFPPVLFMLLLLLLLLLLLFPADFPP